MIVYPAIDIRDGKCVRLVAGDFDREIVFGMDPAETARRWEADGARWIHVVDLDGAKSGTRFNQEAIESIRESVLCNLQIGGGIRYKKDAKHYIDMGFDRVIIGSAAIHSGKLVQSIAKAWPGKVAVGLDARDGLLAGDGWLDQTSVRATDVAAERLEQGASAIIYTDISRDGTLTGPNLEAVQNMVAIAGDSLIASGGIGTIHDVVNVRHTGVGGVIIGRALYDGRVALHSAIENAQEGSPAS